MLTAKYNYSKQGVDCEVGGTTMEIVGELAAMIRGVRETLIEKYDGDAVDETIVNIGRAAYEQKPQDVVNICRPLIEKKKMGGAKAWVNTKKPRPRSQTCVRYVQDVAMCLNR